jgi:hypothetical protein
MTDRMDYLLGMGHIKLSTSSYPANKETPNAIRLQRLW